MTGKEMIDDLRAELKQALEVRAACNMFAFADSRAKIYADAGGRAMTRHDAITLLLHNDPAALAAGLEIPYGPCAEACRLTARIVASPPHKGSLSRLTEEHLNCLLRAWPEAKKMEDEQ
jgi:hypothetical protein